MAPFACRAVGLSVTLVHSSETYIQYIKISLDELGQKHFEALIRLAKFLANQILLKLLSKSGPLNEYGSKFIHNVLHCCEKN